MNKAQSGNQIMASETKSLAVVSGKGGTGKSILSVSLGYLLAHCGFKTLLLDMDLFTGGLTFYSLAEYPRRPLVALQDIFLGQGPPGLISPVAIAHPFVQERLFLYPAFSMRRQSVTELFVDKRIYDLETIVDTLEELIHLAIARHQFDYVIVDTRGGGDNTSVGAVLATESFVMVTEADKTSWDTGGLLLNAIDDAGSSLLSRKTLANRLGFIINKNVLPSEAIESFLRQEWECPHLATVALDPDAIRYFQEDKIPVAEDIGSPFSAGILPVIRKLFVSESWQEDQRKKLWTLESQAMEAEVSRRRERVTITRDERYSLAIRLYGTLLATSILAVTAIFIINPSSETNTFEITFVIAAAVIVFMMTAADPRLIRTIVKRILTPPRD